MNRGRQGWAVKKTRSLLPAAIHEFVRKVTAPAPDTPLGVATACTASVAVTFCIIQQDDCCTPAHQVEGTVVNVNDNTLFSQKLQEKLVLICITCVAVYPQSGRWAEKGSCVQVQDSH